jgi:hypothetical protein
MTRSAIFSDDRSKRYELIRDWRDEPGTPDKTCLFVMLNPSIAGEQADDPTIRKVVGFARRWGYGRVVVVNLVSIVSTDPWNLPPWNGIDMKNRAVTQSWMGQADIVVAAWGSPPKALARTIALSELVYLLRQTAPVALHCIGTTKHGDPLHPSRVAYTSASELWKEAE